MVCQTCGAPVAGPGTFCSRCGAQVGAYSAPQAGAVPPPSAYPPPTAYPGQAYVPPPAAYPPPVHTRVTRHLQALGILWFVYGAYRAASGLFGALVLAGLSSRMSIERWGLPGRMWGMPHGPLFGALSGFVIVYTAISAALAFVTGYGLSTRLGWARVLGIVSGILALFHPIAGTALGIYTLWVLAPNTSAMEYDALAERG